MVVSAYHGCAAAHASLAASDLPMAIHNACTVGHRVTDAATLTVAKRVFEQANSELTAALRKGGALSKLYTVPARSFRLAR